MLQQKSPQTETSDKDHQNRLLHLNCKEPKLELTNSTSRSIAQPRILQITLDDLGTPTKRTWHYACKRCVIRQGKNL
jgi:hypothetical protein